MMGKMASIESNDSQAHAVLQDIAKRAMLKRGLLPDFSAKAMAELGKIQAPSAIDGVKARDLRDLSWASIDNDDSRDLDQLTAAFAISDDNVKILVAFARRNQEKFFILKI